VLLPVNQLPPNSELNTKSCALASERNVRPIKEFALSNTKSCGADRAKGKTAPGMCFSQFSGRIPDVDSHPPRPVERIRNAWR